MLRPPRLRSSLTNPFKVHFYLRYQLFVYIFTSYLFTFYQLFVYIFISHLFTFNLLFIYILLAICLHFISCVLSSVSCSFTILSAVCLHFLSACYCLLIVASLRPKNQLKKQIPPDLSFVGPRSKSFIIITILGSPGGFE